MVAKINCRKEKVAYIFLMHRLKGILVGRIVGVGRGHDMKLHKGKMVLGGFSFSFSRVTGFCKIIGLTKKYFRDMWAIFLRGQK